MVSAQFTINNLPVPDESVQRVTAGSTVTVKLTSKLGVSSVAWSCHGIFPVDLVRPTFTQTDIDTATFTVPNAEDGYGVSVGIQCVVNNGFNAAGRVDNNLVSKSMVWVTDTLGGRTQIFFDGQTTEGGAYGWATEVNRQLSELFHVVRH